MRSTVACPRTMSYQELQNCVLIIDYHSLVHSFNEKSEFYNFYFLCVEKELAIYVWLYLELLM